MMIDLHTHILPGMDDGASDIQASLKMLEMAAANDTTVIFATPHFIPGSLENKKTAVMKKYHFLVQEAAAKVPNIKILPGCEVFISPEVPDLLDEGVICTLNQSDYILVELPMMSIPVYMDEVLYQLRLRGYYPIIAHPERNREIAANPDILYNLLRRGIYAQINTTSVTGIYGRKVQNTAFTLLKNDMVHFVASDAHTCNGRSPKLVRARELVESEVGAEAAERLFETNALAVIGNEIFEAPEPRSVSGTKRGNNFFFRNLARIFSNLH